MAGWHLHFVTDGRSGGWHLLDCRAVGLRAQLRELADVRIAMSETAAFLRADLPRPHKGPRRGRTEMTPPRMNRMAPAHCATNLFSRTRPWHGWRQELERGRPNTAGQWPEPHSLEIRADKAQSARSRRIRLPQVKRASSSASDVRIAWDCPLFYILVRHLLDPSANQGHSVMAIDPDHPC